jgi:hypothetical protein
MKVSGSEYWLEHELVESPSASRERKYSVEMLHVRPLPQRVAEANKNGSRSRGSQTEFAEPSHGRILS